MKTLRRLKCFLFGKSFADIRIIVLESIRDRTISGRDLRAILDEHGIHKSAAAFYHLMSKLEGAGCVKGEYIPRMIDGVKVKERFYRIVKSPALK